MNTKATKIQDKKQNLLLIKKYIKGNADAIQKLATQKHKEFLNDIPFRSEFIEKYQKNHIKLVKLIADNLDYDTIMDNTKKFKALGEAMAKDSVKDRLTIEEAVDGNIFLKQAIWETLNKKGWFNKINSQESYSINQTISTYSDVVTSRLTFAYQTYHDQLLREETEKRESLQKKKDEFLNEVSHELKTPLTSIKAYTQILTKRLMGDTKNTYFLTQIEAQVTKVTGLLDDLLEAGKLEEGKLPLDKKSTDLNKLVKKVVIDFQYTTEGHEIVSEGELSKKIVIDEGKIEQVLVNLITNAVKYSPKGTKIIVHISNTIDEAQICVQDFGIGIPKSKQKDLFTRYYRVSEKGEAKNKGFGLGLYISAEIVKRHGGEVSVKSSSKKGTTFCFTLPLKRNSD